MKIEIMGYSGSGKSTLCRELAERYGVPALHLDRIQFLPNWEIRSEEEKKALVAAFLDENPEGWVIDGNYSKLSYERRNEEADQIIQLLFGRINCLFRCAKRFWKYKGKSRPDMGEGAMKSWIGSLCGGSFGKGGRKRLGKGTGGFGSSIRRK